MSKAVTKNASVLMTSGFAGVAIWLSVASLYYVTERNNPNTIWTFDEVCLRYGLLVCWCERLWSGTGFDCGVFFGVMVLRRRGRTTRETMVVREGL